MPSPYLCYIHMASSTPQLRVVFSEPGDALADIVNSEVRSWPGFEAVEVYDEFDQAILRFTRGALVVIH